MNTVIRDRTQMSEKNLWVYDNCNKEFFFGNIDGFCYKNATKILRIVEWKHENEYLSKGELTVFPLLARLVYVGVFMGLFSEGSGVFIVRGEIPYTNGAMISNSKDENRIHYTKEQLINFIQCEFSDVKR